MNWFHDMKYFLTLNSLLFAVHGSPTEILDSRKIKNQCAVPLGGQMEPLRLEISAACRREQKWGKKRTEIGALGKG